MSRKLYKPQTSRKLTINDNSLSYWALAIEFL